MSSVESCPHTGCEHYMHHVEDNVYRCAEHGKFEKRDLEDVPAHEWVDADE